MTVIDWHVRRTFTWDHSTLVVLHDALGRIPSGSWSAEPRGHELAFYEILSGSCHDRRGFGRLLRCGAALATAWTVFRALGHELAVEFPDDPDRLDHLASLRVVGVSLSSSGDYAQYAAIRQLAEPAAGEQMPAVDAAALDAIATADVWAETRIVAVRPEWMPAFVTPADGSALLTLTPSDARRHHVLAGAALCHARLSAAADGLRTRVLSRRLHEPAVRAELIAAAALPGVPQALLQLDTRHRNGARR